MSLGHLDNLYRYWLVPISAIISALIIFLYFYHRFKVELRENIEEAILPAFEKLLVSPSVCISIFSGTSWNLGNTFHWKVFKWKTFSSREIWEKLLSAKRQPFFSGLNVLMDIGMTIAGINFVYTPIQWEMMVQCNVVSHWLGAFTKLSLPLSPLRSKFSNQGTISKALFTS